LQDVSTESGNGFAMTTGLVCGEWRVGITQPLKNATLKGYDIQGYSTSRNHDSK